MKNTITSREIVSVPVQQASTYNQVKITQLIVVEAEGSTKLKATLDLYDGGKILSGHTFNVSIDSIEKEFPQIQDAWDRMTNIIGKYYLQDHIKTEISNKRNRGQDVASLIIELDAAIIEVQKPIINI